MSVHIIAVGVLKSFVPSDVADAPAGESVEQAVTRLGIPSDLVAMALVNGRQVGKDAILRDDDIVKLIPLVGGG